MILTVLQYLHSTLLILQQIYCTIIFMNQSHLHSTLLILQHNLVALTGESQKLFTFYFTYITTYRNVEETSD